jgi:hypothetical protein
VTERTHTQARPLAATPKLASLLARMGSRLRRQVWLHGVGTLLSLVGAWLVFAFVIDFFLRVPRGVRALLLLVLIALPAWILWRYLLRPLRALPGRADLAVLIERQRPRLRQLFLSAVDLQESPAPSGDPELIREVCAQAETEATTVDLAGILEERPPARRFALGIGTALACATLAFAVPLYASIFLQRLLGRAVQWPQRTSLEVSLPISGERAQVESTPEAIRAKVARGTDVPVVVRARGLVPEEVRLSFASASDLVLPANSEGVFRTLLRSLQTDLEFTVRGGDDDDGLPRVSIEVLEPPDVAGLAIAIQPPAYTGLLPRVEFDRDVEVPAGSELSVAMLPSPIDAHGKVRILPADQVLELTPVPFPGQGGAPSTATGLGFSIAAQSSLRFRFELEDNSGLSNPDPGLFAVNVAEDHRPEVELIAPGRGEVDTVLGGTLPLRARATDDFGVRSMSYTIKSAATEDPGRTQELELRRLSDGTPVAQDSAPATAVIGGVRLEVTALFSPENPPVEGAQFTLDVTALDNRPTEGATAEAATGRAAQVRVRVVSVEEFLRRVQDRLARLRQTASELEDLQRQKARRAQELVVSLESDSPALGSSGSELNAVLAGQRRVEGDAEALARELASVTEGVLYARLDEKAGGALEKLDLALQAARDKGFQTAAWRELVLASRRGELGAQGFAAQLVGLYDLAQQISTDDCRPASVALERAAQAVDLAEIHAALSEATGHQRNALGHIEELLGRLSEWDNFQSILSLTRDILNRQKSLMGRIQGAAREK